MLVKSQVKYIQSLSQKKFRDTEGLFVAEGPKIINELLCAGNVKPHSIFALKGWIDANAAAVKKNGSIVTEIGESELKRISFHTTPNQAIAVFYKPVFRKRNVADTVCLVLDNIQDPGNMGTIVRTADWFGLETIICSENTVDVFGPKTIQSTMGSIGRVEVVYEKPEKLLDKHRNIPAYAATLEGENVFEMKSIKKGFIIIGNESKGISEALLKKAHHRITIPKKGKVESLNAAVAAGIILSRLIGV
ncbi:MAG: RNA methyltransferase [Bacteroidota bacterium]